VAEIAQYNPRQGRRFGRFSVLADLALIVEKHIEGEGHEENKTETQPA
jgi:hypothetical protein